ncbi:Outer membrane protein assembly factor BamA [Mesonia phycicola]|uniref:Outer membrane protein assembly factor BamA n=1 Tax=Mesonia phycicola TaxID=579105 RepID=A0A1M6C3M2_9FLAO|nr:BamA/TamA family outer membrane protein [Mesonia phycicola]SHI55655.1 Outer membrane protein assembly factor BamA [Mesonia phycicola]
MKKNNILLTICIIFLASSCATFGPKINEDYPQDSISYPSSKKLEKRFFLIGDAGYSNMGSSSLGVQAFKYFIDSSDTKNTYAVFLGDNIYPAGMPGKEDPLRKQSESRIDAQINALENYDGNILFIPGNHDWYNEGLDGVKEQADYIKDKTKQKDVWAPKPGCGLEIRDLTDNLTLIIIDSQWYLEDWDDSPTINDNCSEIKTRDALFAEIESELKKGQNKNIVIALHHPMYTNGVHGGNYHLNRHLYPSQSKIPMPVLGSLAMLIRTTGGVSIQDAQNERYKSFRDRLETISKNYERVTYISGHEHNMQYVIHDGLHQIISGAGSKRSYASLRNDGVFAYPDQGFAVYDVFKDKSTWVRFYGSENGLPKLLFQTEVFQKETAPNLDNLPDPNSFSKEIEVSIYNEEDTDKSEVYESLWGDHYRKLYGKKIKTKVALLDTLYGGLTVVREGGGHQTRSIRVKDSLGRDYNIRALKKSAVQFLQTVAFKDQSVEQKFQNTLAEDAIEDFYTASHPFAFMAIPKLSDAAEIFHTNPKVIYLPQQKALGKYNEAYGDDIYMIVERPEGDWKEAEFFGSPNHDIESTEGMFERLRRDEKYSLDEVAYIRARIFDMLIGDWDRHKDQWRWAEFETEDGKHIFRPIPRDRDQAFSNFDGAFFGTLKGLAGFAKQFGEYGDDIDDVAWFNTAAAGLDRSLIQNKGRETWIAEAKYLQDHITDEVIEEAFNDLPEEVRKDESTQDIKTFLKARKENIVDIAERYYNYLAKLAIVTATDKDDFIDVTRLENGKTKIEIFRNKGGKRKSLFSKKTYDKKDTKEIWIYGLDDDDTFTVVGNSKSKNIPIKLIGGQNNDIYKVDNSKKLKIYEHKSKPNTFTDAQDAKIRLSDNYEQNFFNKDKKIFSSNVILPGIGYNPDDGVKIGLQDVYTHYGFKRDPFSSQHKFRAGYYFATNGFDFYYDARFARIVGNYSLGVGAWFTSPNFAQNFFGYGNSTRNPNRDNDEDFDFNRTKISKVGASIGLVRESPFGSYFGYKASFESVEVDQTSGRFIDQYFANNANVFERKYFAGLDATYRYESYDDVLNPTNGMKFQLSVGGKMNTKDTQNIYGYIKPSIEFFNSITRNRKWVLRTEVNSQINIGDDFEFYQAANLGGATGLRGYRNERFMGESSLATSADIRYTLGEVKTTFLPFEFGIFGGADVGRVWLDGEDSKQWHNDFGGGLWVNSAEAVNGTFNLFAGEDGMRFSFGFGFKF